MQKRTILALYLGLAVLIMLSCQQGLAPAGSASPEDVLKYLPVDAQGVFFIDIHNALATGVADKMMQDQDEYQKYLEFVEKSGIDPKKDVYYVAAAIVSEDPKKQEGAAVVNLKYEEQKILTLIEEESGSPPVILDYNGISLFTVEDEEENGFAFLDASNIVVGDLGSVKAVLDVKQKTRDNVFKNPDLAELLKKTDKDTLFWGAMLIPPKALEEASAANPRLEALKSLTAVILNFDYRSRTVMANIKALSNDADKNKQIAEMLTGFKAMGAMLAADKPELGELLDAIAITSGDDHVQITANIPEELVQKLKSEIPLDQLEKK
jgi:hypothetical protein